MHIDNRVSIERAFERYLRRVDPCISEHDTKLTRMLFMKSVVKEENKQKDWRKKHNKQVKKKVKRLGEIIGAGFNKANAKACPGCTVFDKPNGCCGGCNAGYFKLWCFEEDVKYEKLRYKHTPCHGKPGFFNEYKQCCNIPRHKRSHTCLSFRCEKLVKASVPHRMERLDKLISELRSLRSELGYLD